MSDETQQAPVETTQEQPVATPESTPAEKTFVGGKFKSAEALEKSYVELSKLLGKQGKVSDEQLKALLGTPDETPPKEEDKTKGKDSPLTIKPEEAQEEAKEIVESVGLDFDKYNEEFSQKGELSEESFAELEKKGLPKELVSAYIDGQKALAAQQMQSIYNVVGGETNYTEMVAWAAKNLSAEEIKAFNKAVTGSIDETRFAVQGLNARFKSKVGSAPNLMRGSETSTSVSGYESKAQHIADVSDPRYKTDPAFRKMVEEKLKRSKMIYG